MLRFVRNPARQAARSFSLSPARSDMAKLTAIGRVGTDIASQESANGRTYLRYALAVNSLTNPPTTSWFNVVVFDPNAIQFMKSYVKKGSNVYVEANASVQIYENQEGRRQSSLQLVQQNITFVGSKKRSPSDEEDQVD